MAQEERKKKDLLAIVRHWMVRASSFSPPPEVFSSTHDSRFCFVFFLVRGTVNPGHRSTALFFEKKKVGVGGVTKAWTMKEKAKKKK